MSLTERVFVSSTNAVNLQASKGLLNGTLRTLCASRGVMTVPGTIAKLKEMFLPL